MQPEMHSNLKNTLCSIVPSNLDKFPAQKYIKITKMNTPNGLGNLTFWGSFGIMLAPGVHNGSGRLCQTTLVELGPPNLVDAE